ncbi:hypothetical protein FRC11_006203 [Ceratobasidium sp. 423]|nr:hypothetical protein FRC11_006203 [Ceratobasidium sp. 423]
MGSKVVQENSELPVPQSIASATTGETSDALSTSKDKSVALESYHSMLKLLKLSMNQLKLSTRIQVEPQFSNSFASQATNECAEPGPPPLSHAQIKHPLPKPVSEAQPKEDGPTLQDAREVAFVEPVDVDLLEEVDEEDRDEPFDVSLNRHLK